MIAKNDYLPKNYVSENMKYQTNNIDKVENKNRLIDIFLNNPGNNNEQKVISENRFRSDNIYNSFKKDGKSDYLSQPSYAMSSKNQNLNFENHNSEYNYITNDRNNKNLGENYRNMDKDLNKNTENNFDQRMNNRNNSNFKPVLPADIISEEEENQENERKTRSKLRSNNFKSFEGPNFQKFQNPTTSFKNLNSLNNQDVSHAFTTNNERSNADFFKDAKSFNNYNRNQSLESSRYKSSHHIKSMNNDTFFNASKSVLKNFDFSLKSFASNRPDLPQTLKYQELTLNLEVNFFN